MLSKGSAVSQSSVAVSKRSLFGTTFLTRTKDLRCCRVSVSPKPGPHIRGRRSSLTKRAYLCAPYPFCQVVLVQSLRLCAFPYVRWDMLGEPGLKPVTPDLSSLGYIP